MRISDEDEDEDEEDDEDEDEDEDPDSEDDKERSITVTGADGRIMRLVPRKSTRRSGPNRINKETRKFERRHGESEDGYRTRCRRSAPEYRAAFNAYLTDGFSALGGKHARAIQADSDIVGGYLVAPQEFVGKLIKFVDDLVYIRQVATKYTIESAQSLGAPSLDTDIADADWTSELATGNEDTALAFGKRELYPHPLAKRIKVSNKLLRSAQNITTFSDSGNITGGAENIVRNRLGYKFAITEEKGFLTGNGSQQPLGLFTASSRGISTARDVVTGNTTGYTADSLFDAKYSLKQQYQAKAKWLFHRDSVRLIRKLKDGMGQYLWMPGIENGAVDKLLDSPLMISEYVPNTFTTGLYVGMIGDFSFYWIADAETMQIQRLVELYAEANQTGFIARLELDGMPVLEEAFARIKTS